MIRALIIEDEQLAAGRLEKLLSELGNDLEVVATRGSVREAVKYLSLNQPDLIFMDIELGDGNAFEIFERVQVNSPVIFTTAYDRYAIRAFKVNSIDYLLKPVNREELSEALNKFLERSLPVRGLELGNLIRSIQEQKNYKQRFMVYAGHKIISVSTKNITCFFSIEKGQYLVTFTGKTYTIDHSLDQLEELVDPSRFFRINRQVLIHVEAIKEIEPLSKSRLKVIMQNTIPVETLVSVHRTAAFRKWLEGA